MKTTLLVVALMMSCSPWALAQSPFWGPVTLERLPGAPQTAEYGFSVPDSTWEYTLVVSAGSDSVGPGDTSQSQKGISSALVRINGEEVISHNDFNQTVREVSKIIHLTTANSLEAELAGAPGSSMSITVLGPSTTQTVGADGGTLSVAGIGSVVIPVGALLSDQDVTLTVTADSVTREIFDHSTLVYAAGPSFSFEIRVITGQVIFEEECVVSLRVPTWIDQYLATDFDLQTFVQSYDDGNGTGLYQFEMTPSDYDEEARLLTVSLPPSAFSVVLDQVGSYELVIVVGSTPQYWRE